MRDADSIELTAGRRLRTYAVGTIAALVVAGTIIGINLQRGAAPAAVHPTPRPSPSAQVHESVRIQFLSPGVGFAEVFRGQPGHIYRTLDAGKTWSIAWEGPEMQFQFFDANDGFAWGPELGTLFVTTNGGFSWTARRWPAPLKPSTVSFASAEDGLALFTEPVDLESGTQAATLYRTRDGGQTWTQVASASGPAATLPLAASKSDLGFGSGGLAWLIAATAKGRQIWVSRDSGASWFLTGLPSPPAVGLESPEPRIQEAAGTLALSTQWVRGPVTYSGPAYAFNAPSGPVPTGLYLLGSDDTWQQRMATDEPFGQFAAAAAEDGTGYIIGGLTDCVSPPSPPTLCGPSQRAEGSLTSLEVLSANTLLAVDGPGSLSYMTRDGGAHWSAMVLPLS